MKKYLVILFFPVLSFGLITVDQKNQATVAPKNYQTLDLNQFDKINSKSPSQNELSFSMTCKNQNGTVLKLGDSEYDSCMREAGRNKIKDNNANSEAQLNFN